MFGCGDSSGAISPDGDDPNVRKVERGRLKFVISATSIHTKTTSIYRSVHSQFYVDGKEWSPEKDFIPPPETWKKFVWKKDANGKDKLVVPQLLEKVER